MNACADAARMDEVERLFPIRQPQGLVQITDLGSDVLWSVGQVDRVDVIGNDLLAYMSDASQES
jgi:hypothetical protein